VCLIEAGGRAWHPYINVPALVGPAIMNKGLGWGLFTEPQAELNQRRIPVPRGKVIGGSGSINGMAYHRGHPKDYDDWAGAGNHGWSFADVLPYFLRSENNADLRDPALHGTAGPIHVEHIAKPNALNQAFLDAFASEGGYTHCTDFTGLNPEGYGLRQGTIYRGRRQSSAVAYLAPAMRRPNLTVLTRSTVSRVVIENGRARGVEYIRDGRVQQLQATREVIVSAGAIHSPAVLLLSGIGPANDLRALNIPVTADLPGVGANFHDHPAFNLTLEMRDSTSYGLSWRALPRNLWSVVNYALTRRGQLATNVFESTAFIRSSDAVDRPDIQIAFQPARRNPNAFPLPLGHGFAMSVVNLYPRSRGRITLASNDPLAAPRIDPALLADAADIAPLLRGMRLARRLSQATPLARYQAHEVLPGPTVQDDVALTDYLRRAAGTVHHPVGSCRMGQDSMAVVDANLRVRGIENFRVVDASIFPSIVGGNTNAPIVMVAERATDLILGRLRA
jgi:choline dehydrogenase